MNRKSKRFSPNTLSEKLVPVILGFLALVLLGTMLLIILIVAGLLP